MRITVVPALADLAAQAEAAVNAALAGTNGYARKVAEARTALGGKASSLIAGEAKLRDTTPRQLARLILERAAADDARELARVELVLNIRSASSVAEIQHILKNAGISLPRNDGVAHGL